MEIFAHHSTAHTININLAVIVLIAAPVLVAFIARRINK